jgi:hypothetical protein
MFPSVLAALGQVGATTMPQNPWAQFGFAGVVAGMLLGLFGWILKRLVDGLLRQNMQQNVSQIAKLDEIKGELGRLGERVVGRLDALSEKMVAELGSTKTILHAVADETVGELERLRADLGAGSRTTDTPLPAPAPRRPYRGTPVVGVAQIPRSGVTPPADRGKRG